MSRGPCNSTWQTHLGPRPILPLAATSQLIFSSISSSFSADMHCSHFPVVRRWSWGMARHCSPCPAATIADRRCLRDPAVPPPPPSAVPCWDQVWGGASPSGPTVFSYQGMRVRPIVRGAVCGPRELCWQTCAARASRQPLPQRFLFPMMGQSGKVHTVRGQAPPSPGLRTRTDPPDLPLMMMGPLARTLRSLSPPGMGRTSRPLLSVVIPPDPFPHPGSGGTEIRRPPLAVF